MASGSGVRSQPVFPPSPVSRRTVDRSLALRRCETSVPSAPDSSFLAKRQLHAFWANPTELAAHPSGTIQSSPSAPFAPWNGTFTKRRTSYTLRSADLGTSVGSAARALSCSSAGASVRSHQLEQHSEHRRRYWRGPWLFPTDDPTNYLRSSGTTPGRRTASTYQRGHPVMHDRQFDPLRGDPSSRLDMRLAKNIKIGERMNIQLIGQAFNLTNRATMAPTTAITSVPPTLWSPGRFSSIRATRRLLAHYGVSSAYRFTF